MCLTLKNRDFRDFRDMQANKTPVLPDYPENL
nr:MAG TPA: hypothetical protein [Caudoviricetes sp.]